MSDLPIARVLEALTAETHFQPAVLSRREYILPMSPMPIMPMLLRWSMVVCVMHAKLRGCGDSVQPMLVQESRGQGLRSEVEEKSAHGRALGVRRHLLPHIA